jgi:hypothetical protein
MKNSNIWLPRLQRSNGLVVELLNSGLRLAPHIATIGLGAPLD